MHLALICLAHNIMIVSQIFNMQMEFYEHLYGLPKTQLKCVVDHVSHKFAYS